MTNLICHNLDNMSIEKYAPLMSILLCIYCYAVRIAIMGLLTLNLRNPNGWFLMLKLYITDAEDLW